MSSWKCILRGLLPTVFPTWAPPEALLAEGKSTRAPDRDTIGSSSPAPRGCHRAASSRTPSTFRLWSRPLMGGSGSETGSAGRTLVVLKLAPAGLL